MKRLWFGGIGFAALAACGGSVVAESTGGGGTASSSTSGAGASSTSGTSGTSGVGGGTTIIGCPATPPNTNVSCAGVPDQLRCTYGTGARPDCREAWICMSGTWESPGTACSEPPAGDCKASEPAAQTTCPNEGDVCVYGSTLCYCGCAGDLCAMPYDWNCSDAPATAGCPAIVPNDGTACSDAGLSCGYGTSCSPDFALVTCNGGFWTWATGIACN